MSGGIVVVCGLNAEAKLARGPDVAATLAGGGDAMRLRADLARAAATARAVLSFGIAGGLDPALRPGALRVARAVVAPGGGHLPVHSGWTAAIARALGIETAVFAGADAPVADPAAKAALRASTGADMVDMETHIAAAVAAAHGLPFAALRAVTDAADGRLPHAAATSMRPDGSVDVAAVLRSLARDPRQIPDLVRTGLDTRRAFASLFRGRQRLGPGFAFVDLGEPLLHVP